MIIETAELWVAATNCYVVAPERGGPAVVVDVPPDVPAVLDLLDRHDLTPVAALVTHGHIDHTGGAGKLVAATRVAAYLHPDDAWLAADPLSQLQSIFGFAPPGAAEEFAAPAQFVDLADGDRLEFAGLAFEVIHTPGHTPGHVCFSLRGAGVLFSGDQLFRDSIGRTDLPGGNFRQLMESMDDKILTFGDDTRVLPGHGPETTIGRERRYNPFLQAYRS